MYRTRLKPRACSACQTPVDLTPAMSVRAIRTSIEKIPQNKVEFQGLSTASGYDVDAEHAYIMAKALRSYRDHTQRDQSGKPCQPRHLRKRVRSAPPVQRQQIIIPSQPIPGSLKLAQYTRPVRPARPKSASEAALEAIRAVGQANSVETDRPPRPFLRTGRINIPHVPMDKVGTSYEAESPRRKFNYETGVFSMVRSPKKNYFTIHPEWVSENLAIHKMSLQERDNNLQLAREKCMTYPPRRCRSAPPPRSRNIITWENT